MLKETRSYWTRRRYPSRVGPVVILIIIIISSKSLPDDYNTIYDEDDTEWM
ncbi:hypothetical protein ABGV40_05435 [Paenibacillus amylolyticus]|uniref:hypothetical protein n=1 Tax=Paenibacillus amylolyticus TaxID=1451 RepID=UPI000AECBD30